MTPLRVSMGVRYFEPRGGAEKFSLSLARFLARRGHRVRVHAFRGGPMEGVELRLLPFPRLAGRAWRDWATGRGLAAALAVDDADVTWGEQKTWSANVIRPGGGSEAEYWSAHASFRGEDGGASWTGLLHLKRLFDLAAERRGFESPEFRRVVVNSELVRGHLLSHYPALAGRIEVVHNGAEPRLSPVGRSDRREVLGALRLEAAAPTALFAGHDFRRKGLTHALRAVAAARRRDPTWPLQLVVAGRDRPGDHARQARVLGLGAAVAFAGTRQDLAALFGAADVLLFPTLFDPFANVTVEALAAGLPVLTTRRNGGHELIADGVEGWAVEDPADAEALAGHLLELRDPARRAAMSRAALACAARHTLESKLLRIEQILAQVAEGNRAGVGEV
jgi:UDP-glucose:(heptosyl)LPS alpha-1,3-glucosyltransferase